MYEERLKKAKKNFDQFLKEGILVKGTADKKKIARLKSNSLESLKVAELLYEEETSMLWVTVASYYAMFYIANAYMHQKGYLTRHSIVHKVVNETMIVVARNNLRDELLTNYEEEREKALAVADQLLDSFEFERAKRSSFQYETTDEIKKNKANTSLERAKNFVAAFRKLML